MLIIIKLALAALVGYVAGVMHARNLNRQDRAYWMAQGARAAFNKSKEVLQNQLEGIKEKQA